MPCTCLEPTSSLVLSQIRTNYTKEGPDWSYGYNNVPSTLFNTDTGCREPGGFSCNNEIPSTSVSTMVLIDTWHDASKGSRLNITMLRCFGQGPCLPAPRKPPSFTCHTIQGNETTLLEMFCQFMVLVYREFQSSLLSGFFNRMPYLTGISTMT